jgi:hypothetical protein
LSTPAASIRARRAQPGLAARAEIVRASWFFGTATFRDQAGDGATMDIAGEAAAE